MTNPDQKYIRYDNNYLLTTRLIESVHQELVFGRAQAATPRTFNHNFPRDLKLDPSLTHLFVEVLRLAIQDLTIEFNPRIQLQAQRWIRDSSPEIPFSFDWICNHLNYPTNQLRHYLLNQHKER